MRWPLVILEGLPPVIAVSIGVLRGEPLTQHILIGSAWVILCVVRRLGDRFDERT